ncbi:rab-like protein 6 isoform X7 [Dunckerocampus dactyliophorus]|uniref:rab-like protein 6 isoform X7 n=1 Tax=Dunckerocampus dactyliophorus TaxID=161453 RepID=UPI002406D0C4|nr:rab-like protein 6 isoform X7 [Dunckerocampus dactyliophorus]
MFSALKKLVGSEPGQQLREKNIPAGLQSMNQSLQRRFAKGVQYNMKIVIRGDRNTGKSTLWYRLQGKKFVEEYIPTQEIQATSIHWNYKTTDDVVKVEVWDVVDKGKGKRRGDNLKLENEPQESDEVALDAEFLDVYKNCNGVIMMFDITKQWTFNYIVRELPKVPNHIPVCVLGNHRDMGEHRVILPDDIRDLIAGLNRPVGSSYIHYAESSMKNGFGLKYLHRFFNIPFLQLQRETLLRQLETNQLDIDATLEELTVQQETEDQNYEIFLEHLECRSKGYGSPGPANGQSPSSGSQSPIVPPSGASTGSSSPSTPQPPVPSQPPPQSPSVSAPSASVLAAAIGRAASPSADFKSAAQSPEHLQSAAALASAPQKRGFMSRWFGLSPAPESSASASDDPPAPACPAVVQSVDDFVPEERLDKSFLEDNLPSKTKMSQPVTALDSDSDGEDRGNPMVSGFQDELDPDDAEPSLPQAKTLSHSKDVTLSSDEEEQAPAAPTVKKDQDLDSEPELKAHIRKPKGPKASEPRDQTSAPIFLTLTPAAEQPKQQSKKKGMPPMAEDSDTDADTPMAQQMLSFVMDDPDFESEAFDTPKIEKSTFPVRHELLSDLSDDDIQSAKASEPAKPTVILFKHQDDTDLFGLGIQEDPPATKESSDEQEDKESKHSTKEKKKKKKKSKEEDEKSKKHKHKKKDKDEAGDCKEKKKKKTRSKKTDVDELEDFLGGGSKSATRDDGDYEEL